MQTKQPRLRLFGEVMGWSPLPERLRQAKIALAGEQDVPPSRFGLSSLKQLYPKISPRLWRGRPYIKNTVIISNLFNHTQTPIEQGWSVQKTQTLDFRGKGLTYNSHNGTDFAIPVGSTVCAAAPGKIVLVHAEFNRGGLKIYIDHGEGLITTYAHLARSLVKTGDVVHRGQPIALSGYSGIDGAVTFPLGIPHVHFNVWLNSEPVDPFAHGPHSSLWKHGALPQPEVDLGQTDLAELDATKVDAVIRHCKTASVRQELTSLQSEYDRGMRTIIRMNYYPTRFTLRTNVYQNNYLRMPRLTLPFSEQEFNRIVFLDEL